MSIENANYIGGLNPLLPAPNDSKSQGDDHIRLEKKALLNTFAGFAGAVLVTGADGGTVNDYTVTTTPPLPSYVARMAVVFMPSITNTAASTLNISGMGVKPLRSVSGAELLPGELTPGTLYSAIYTGSEFRLTGITKSYADNLGLSAALPAQSLGFLRSNGTTAGFTQTHTGYAHKETRGADIASAASVDLTAATGNLVHITGNVTITAIAVAPGAQYTLIFDGTPTITNSASLSLPGNVNIVAEAGDRVVVRGDTGGAVVTCYTRASGKPLAGGLELLSAVAVTTPVAAVDFLNIFSANYDSYVIEVLGGNSTQLQMQFAVGGVVDASSSYVPLVPNGATGTTLNTGAVITSSSSFGRGAQSTVKVMGVNVAGRDKMILADSAAQRSVTPSWGAESRSTLYIANTPVSGFRLYVISGTFTASSIQIFGQRNS